MIQRTHFTWNIEQVDGHCPRCSGKTVLVSACEWQSHYDENDEGGEGVEYEHGPPDEVTGHWCKECDRLTALSLNTLPVKEATCD